LEALTVDLVNLVELETWFCLERGKLAYGLGSKRPAIDQKQDALGHTRFHQAVDLVDCHKGLASSGRHGHEHMPFAVLRACSIAVFASRWYGRNLGWSLGMWRS